jgi:serine/threonine protein phosphatase PrpC
MIEDAHLSKLMRSSENSNVTIENMINAANLAGGYDNISAVYIEIMTKSEV